MQPIRRWSVLGDLHTGSRGGLWSPYRTKEGSWLYPNPGQEYLLECFHDYTHWVEETGGADTVLLGGDLCDGNNKKEHGRSLSSVELLEQVDVCESLLKPFCEGKNVVSLEGSWYHQGADVSLDSIIADRLKVKYHDTLLFLKVQDTPWTVMTYHKGRTGGIYRASALESECRAIDVAIARGDITHPVDMIIRFHSHYSLSIRYKHRLMLQSACWKLWFAGNIGTVGYGDRVPAIGGHVVEFYEDRIEVKNRIYPYFRADDKRRVA